jgi:hypothetical protein
MHTRLRTTGAPRRTIERVGLGLLSLVVFLASCNHAPAAPAWAPAERLVGSWRWVSSLDVTTQALRSPATEGFDAELRFAAGSARSGTFVYTRAGADPVHGRFRITYEDAPGNDFIELEPGIDFLARNAWVAAGRDTLRLGGVFERGHNSVYARVTE